MKDKTENTERDGEARPFEALVICADCGKGIRWNENAIKKAKSARAGLYYKGDPICQSCADERYDNAILELEVEDSVHHS